MTQEPAPGAEVPPRPTEADALVTFVTLRLLEDERFAAACPSPDWELGIVYGSVIARAGGRIALEAPKQSIADHIARHDPARALRQVAAGRMLLNRYARATAVPGSTSVWMRGQDDGYRQGLHDALVDLSQTYSDHEAFDPAWLGDDQ